MKNIKNQNRAIRSSEYNELRASVGWDEIPSEFVQQGLVNTLYSSLGYVDGKLAGMGRVVGDGFIYFYIQDMIVKPEYQGLGVGRAILEALLRWWTSSKEKKGIYDACCCSRESFFL